MENAAISLHFKVLRQKCPVGVSAVKRYQIANIRNKLRGDVIDCIQQFSEEEVNILPYYRRNIVSFCTVLPKKYL